MFIIAHADPNMFISGLVFGFGIGAVFAAYRFAGYVTKK